MTDAHSVKRLTDIMRALRDPDTGCPWDVQQDFNSIARYALEEAYEVVDAIETQDYTALRDELGDLLLQVVFHAQMAQEAGMFDFADIVNGISDKMVRRHPHVFTATPVDDAAHVARNWEDIKAQERAEKAAGASNSPPTGPSLLDDVPIALPGLSRAVKLQKRAARVGFDWDALGPILDKLGEEIDELKAEIANNTPKNRLEDELGDVLFVMANLARHLKIDPESAIRSTNRKFTKRFQWMEDQADLTAMSLDEMEIQWQRAKRALNPN